MSPVLILVTFFIVAIISIVIVLHLIQKSHINKYKKQLEFLEKEKNIISGIPINAELAKVQTIVKNEALQDKYKAWQKRYNSIKNTSLPKLTDMLLEVDGLIDLKQFKNIALKFAKTELELYKVKTKAEFLLNEIQEITMSEEKNRTLITKLKAKYRNLSNNFNSHKNEFTGVSKVIDKLIDSINLLFEDFEKNMEINDYLAVSRIVKKIDNDLVTLNIVIDEAPSIINMTKLVIPKKLTDLNTYFKRMQRDGFPLDYLNIEYNIEEIGKKLEDTIYKLKELNVEDSMFELKTINEYIDTLFADFEKEKLNRKIYEDSIINFQNKYNKFNKIMHEIYVQIDSLKESYDLTAENLYNLDKLSRELGKIGDEFKTVTESCNKKIMAYSQLNKELEKLFVKLTKAENELDKCLKTIGNMREDEKRAREQLVDIKNLLRQSKYRLRSYNLPFTPEKYFIQLKDSQDSIKEIIKELNRKPINIAILNTRVDTARDLTLKLYNTTSEMIKTAMMTETAIMYGNRYRSTKVTVEQGLNNAEILFLNGEYKKALELTINTVEMVEPGTYERLLKLYEEK